jgi:hypothetical protein
MSDLWNFITHPEDDFNAVVGWTEDAVNWTNDQINIALKWGQAAVQTLINLGGDVVNICEGVVQGVGNALLAPFKGPGGIIGLMVFAGGFAIELATGLYIPVIPAGYIAGSIVNLVQRNRTISAVEYNYAQSVVFGWTLPSRDSIILTDMTGFNGRQITLKNAAGQYVVGLGPLYDDPLHSTRPNHPAEKEGDIFIHELTHVWQLCYRPFIPFACDSIDAGIRYMQGDSSVYAPQGTKQFYESGPEQQASIVQLWFHDGCRTDHPFYRFIIYNILPCAPNRISYDCAQDGWRLCMKCHGMFWSGKPGVCPADNGPHFTITGGQTFAQFRMPYTGLNVGQAQDNWRWCYKCSGLFYAGFPSPHGVCPADNVQTTASVAGVNLRLKNEHFQSSSLMKIIKKPITSQIANELTQPPPPKGHVWSGPQYRVAVVQTLPGNLPFVDPSTGTIFQPNKDNPQTGWCWCNKCQGIFFTRFGGNGSCPAGGQHNSTSSLPYQMFNTEGFATPAGGDVDAWN